MTLLARTFVATCVVPSLVAFSLLIVPTHMLFTVYGKVQAKRRERKAA